MFWKSRSKKKASEPPSPAEGERIEEVLADDPSGIAVVLLSGGLDSLAALGMAREAGFDPAAIHFNYGQRTEVAELRSFNRICTAMGIPEKQRLVVHTNLFSQVGASALTDPELPVPEADLQSPEVPITYVPFRNAVFLSMAAAWAESLGARVLYYGAVSADSSGYPDCRTEFVDSFNAMIEAGTREEFRTELRAPLLDLSKAEIVKRCRELELPLQYTWSCYTRNDLACGNCDSCALRKRGFWEAGVEDPIRYAPTKAEMNEIRRKNLEKARRLTRLLKALAPEAPAPPPESSETAG